MIPRHDEEGFRSDMAQISSGLSSQLSEIRTRRRNVRRRTTENSEAAIAAVQAFEEFLQGAAQFVKSIRGGSLDGDEYCKQMAEYRNHPLCQAEYGLTIVKKAAQALFVVDLRLQRWHRMVSTTFQFAQTEGRRAPDAPPDAANDAFMSAFLGQQMSITLQKLLKAIPADTVSRLHVRKSTATS